MGVCGTGGFTGPKPGDPDNNVVLNAQTVFGGIDVSWTYPATNPHAVAFVILHRGLTPDYYSSVQHRIVAGNSYFDKIEVTVPTQYYYWIRIVSANGTTAEPIGPDSAYATPTVQDLLEYLTGAIDSSVLAQALKEPLTRIPVIELNLAQEAQNRLNAIGALQTYLSEVGASADQTRALLLQESQAREEEDYAIVERIDLMYAEFDDSISAILQTYETKVDAEQARAALRNTITTEYQGHVATILEDYVTITDSNQALATLQLSIQSDYEGHVATILTNYETAAQAASARAALQTVIQTNYEGYVSTALTSYQTISAANSALSSLRTEVQAYTDTAIAGISVDYTAEVDDINNVLQALYTVRLTVNGLVGGFGIHGTATEIVAGFDVDSFWIGRTNANRVKPFILTGDTVYIDNAVINQLTADKIDSRGLSIRDMAGNIILAAGTALDWSNVGGTGRPEDNATVGADSSNLSVGIGGNLIPNSDLSSGTDNWVAGLKEPGNNFTIGWDLGGVDWIPAGGHQIGLSRTGTGETASGGFAVNLGTQIAVTPNTRYEASAYLSAHRCNASLAVYYFTLTGTTHTFINWVSFGPTTLTGGQSLTNWARVGGFFTTPSNCSYVIIGFIAGAATSADPYAWCTRLFMAQAFASQTELSPWSDGGRSGRFAELNQINAGNASTYIANAAIGNAQIANLSVDTFKLAGEAVFVSRYYSEGSSHTFPANTGTGFVLHEFNYAPGVYPEADMNLIFICAIGFIITSGEAVTPEFALQYRRAGTSTWYQNSAKTLFAFVSLRTEVTLTTSFSLPVDAHDFRIICWGSGSIDTAYTFASRVVLMSGKR